MPLGYLGYMKLAGTYLLANSSGLNRVVEPLRSQAVWGAGWYNAATVTNYADNQQSFEGSVQFELQGNTTIWNLIRDWLIERRVFAKTLEISPNGLTKQLYEQTNSDAASGCWMKSAAFSVDPDSLISINASLVALKRVESQVASDYKAIVNGPGLPSNPLNPSPHNRNPFPGWSAKATITWPGAPAFYSPSNPTGMVLQKADFDINNNTVIIRGCTGESNPVMVLQGTMSVGGSMTLWRDGPIPDPYASGTPFTASGASIQLDFGSTSPLSIQVTHVLLTSDAFDLSGQNSPTVRVFGFEGLGNGLLPPFRMLVAS
jgi:hypothetical protein